MGRKIYIDLRKPGASVVRAPVRPGSFVNSPLTGTPCFGTFPGFRTPHRTFVAGPIHLKQGRHLGPHQGYGLQHIWQERLPNERDAALVERQVTTLIATVLSSGATILYEGGTGKHAARAVVLRRPEGVVVLEESRDGRGEVYYSIVTFYANRNPHGTVVGTMP